VLSAKKALGALTGLGASGYQFLITAPRHIGQAVNRKALS
jgi:hypothetical protein